MRNGGNNNLRKRSERRHKFQPVSETDGSSNFRALFISLHLPSFSKCQKTAQREVREKCSPAAVIFDIRQLISLWSTKLEKAWKLQTNGRAISKTVKFHSEAIIIRK